MANNVMLKKYLTKTSLTQCDFAEAIGVSNGHLSQLISGQKSPSLELAVKIERETDGFVQASSWVPIPAEGAAQ